MRSAVLFILLLFAALGMFTYQTEWFTFWHALEAFGISLLGGLVAGGMFLWIHTNPQEGEWFVVRVIYSTGIIQLLIIAAYMFFLKDSYGAGHIASTGFGVCLVYCIVAVGMEAGVLTEEARKEIDPHP